MIDVNIQYQSPTTEAQTTPQTVETSYIQVNDITYAYRKLGKSTGGFPLLILHHFRAPMDVWNPLFISLVAARREVILSTTVVLGKVQARFPTQ
jgi:hypothetical protein